MTCVLVCFGTPPNLAKPISNTKVGSSVWHEKRKGAMGKYRLLTNHLIEITYLLFTIFLVFAINLWVK